MNTLAKGKRIERLARKWYEARGWTVYAPPWNRWGEKDILSWGDLLCVRSWEGPKLVQVRVREGGSESALRRDGKTDAWKRLEFSGLRLILLLYAGKRRRRVPEWEERAFIMGRWTTIYTTGSSPNARSRSPRTARPSSRASPTKAAPACSAT